MLNETQLKAIHLLVNTNLKKYQVAEKLEIDGSTISRWFQNSEFTKKFDEEMKNSWKEVAAEAKQTMIEMLYGEKESSRITAAKDILSRAGYDASQKIEQVSETTIKVSLDDDMEGGEDAADKSTD